MFHSLLIPLVLFSTRAQAFWDPTWTPRAEIKWTTAKPTASDTVGVAVFCGTAKFSRRTRILVSLQNRMLQDACLEPSTLVEPSDVEKKNARNLMPLLRGRIRGALVNRKMKDIVKNGAEIQMTFGCRVLHAKDNTLTEFEIQEPHAACKQDHLHLANGEIYEATFDFTGEDRPTRFAVNVPQDCGIKKKNVELDFECLKP